MAASYDLPRLLDLLVKSFNLEELHTLAFDLGVDYESLGGAGKEARAREFLLYLNRRGLIPQLVAAARKQRPNVPWHDAYGMPDFFEPPPASDPAPGSALERAGRNDQLTSEARRPPAAEETPGGPTVFISYSHKDEAWKDRLVTQLGVLQRQGLLDLWDDRRIAAGEDWHGEIRAAMGQATVAVLLISADFLTSQFILGEEVPALLQRRDTEGLHIYPIIVRPCAWKAVKWLSRIQVRPKDGRALVRGDRLPDRSRPGRGGGGDRRADGRRLNRPRCRSATDYQSLRGRQPKQSPMQGGLLRAAPRNDCQCRALPPTRHGYSDDALTAVLRQRRRREHGQTHGLHQLQPQGPGMGGSPPAAPGPAGKGRTDHPLGRPAD